MGKCVRPRAVESGQASASDMIPWDGTKTQTNVALSRDVRDLILGVKRRWCGEAGSVGERHGSHIHIPTATEKTGDGWISWGRYHSRAACPV